MFQKLQRKRASRPKPDISLAKNKKITWLQAAGIAGLSDRQLLPRAGALRLGYDGLLGRLPIESR
jgi:hypothetical protein